MLSLRNSSILIVGNGGAARGAAFALADAGAKITLVGRNGDRVRSLAKVCGADAISREQLHSRQFDAVVHATPLGMFPHGNGCFFEGEIPADVVFDLVYNPAETELLRRAREQGKTVIAGAGHVHRAGRAPVRNLDRRDGPPRRNAESRARGAGT